MEESGSEKVVQSHMAPGQSVGQSNTKMLGHRFQSPFESPSMRTVVFRQALARTTVPNPVLGRRTCTASRFHIVSRHPLPSAHLKHVLSPAAMTRSRIISAAT